MKRLAAVLAALLLLAVPASAQTRAGVIWREGEAEPITETLYESGAGFSFWYDASVLAVDDALLGEGGSLFVFPAEGDLSAWLEIMPPESVGMTPREYLDASAAPDTEYERSAGEGGAEIWWFQKWAEDDAGMIRGVYAVQAGADGLIAETTCPIEAEEGFGAFFRQVIWSISFADDAAVRVRWAQDAPLDPEACDECVVDLAEPQARVVFSAAETVTDFRVLALTFEDADDSGEIVFSAEEVYRQDALTPQRPLAVTTAFAGGIPNNGIAYTGADGATHAFAVEISGRDGSLLLLPISLRP